MCESRARALPRGLERQTGGAYRSVDLAPLRLLIIIRAKLVGQARSRVVRFILSPASSIDNALRVKRLFSNFYRKRNIYFRFIFTRSS